MEELVIVDGYNFIFNFYKVSKVTSDTITYLREKLIRDLVSYKHYRNCSVILVFDAKGKDFYQRRFEEVDGIKIIYSAGGESADSVIEELVFCQRGKETKKIFVITSDYLQQKVVFGENIYRKSVREFGIEIGNAARELKKELENLNHYNKKFYNLEKRLKKKQKR